jgi:hypothetical protein
VVGEGCTEIKVVLTSGCGMGLDPAPGRVFLVPAATTLQDLAEAIDVAFARWDRSHLYVFDLPDGRQYFPDEESVAEMGGTSVAGAACLANLGIEAEGQFSYVFDLGEQWTHVCSVRAVDVDPEEVWGGPPPGPVVIDAWGWIPDQYGREEEAPNN